MSLAGKSAIVTGSTSGIGLAIAEALAGAGASVMINGFGEQAAIAGQIERLAAASGARALHDPADMRDAAQIRALVERCSAELGGPDIIVANAGIQHVAAIEHFPDERMEAILAIILASAWHLIKAAVPGMKARGWGRILCTGSAHSLAASPNKSAYVMAKHGLAGLVKTVALETARHGITANIVSPGYVWTPLVEQQIPATMASRGLTREQVMDEVLLAAQPTRRFVTPQEVAAMMLYLCSDAAASVTGANLVIDGGWTAQ